MVWIIYERQQKIFSSHHQYHYILVNCLINFFEVHDDKEYWSSLLPVVKKNLAVQADIDLTIIVNHL